MQQDLCDQWQIEGHLSTSAAVRTKFAANSHPTEKQFLHKEKPVVKK